MHPPSCFCIFSGSEVSEHWLLMTRGIFWNYALCKKQPHHLPAPMWQSWMGSNVLMNSNARQTSLCFCLLWLNKHSGSELMNGTQCSQMVSPKELLWHKKNSFSDPQASQHMSFSWPEESRLWGTVTVWRTQDVGRHSQTAYFIPDLILKNTHNTQGMTHLIFSLITNMY